jgi:nucleoside-diphosphate-sugar epimerase/predicted dehydrogenase
LVLGAGAVVDEYYLPALDALGWIDDALVVDGATAPVQRVQHRWPAVAARTADFRVALEDASGFNACIVALPNSLHAAAAQRALQNGLHVLCEKPLALTSAACCELAGSAKQVQRILGVGMVRRLLPSLNALSEAIAQRLIGDILSMQVDDGEPYAWLSESGTYFAPENGGVLADMGVHYLDFAEEIAGPLRPVRYADDWRGGVEANAEMELVADGGARIHLMLSRTRRLRNALVVHGECGELIVEKDRFDSCLWRSFRTDKVTRLVPESQWAPTLHAAFTRQLVEFAGCIESQSLPRVTADRAASTMRLIEWAYSQHRPTTSGTSANPDVPTMRGPNCVDLPEGAVFITGATGFIGSHLVERLSHGSDREIVAPVRNYRTCAEIARFGVRLPRVDLLDYEQVRAAVRGARYVFHLAYGRTGPNAARVTIEGTRNVVEAAIAAGSEAVVVLSTIYVFGRPSGDVDERFPYRPVGGSYGATKAEMERWCLDRASSSGHTRIVVLCPSCVYGPRGDTYTTLPTQLARAGSWCWIEHGRGAANHVYVQNLIDAMLVAARLPVAHGQRFIINDGTVTWRAFLGALLATTTTDAWPSYTERGLHDLHARRPRPSLVDVVRLAASDARLRATFRRTRFGDFCVRAVNRASPGLLARIPRGDTGEPTRPPILRDRPVEAPLPPEWLADLFGAADTSFSANKAHDTLGWYPRFSLDEGVAATREWLQTIA